MEDFTKQPYYIEQLKLIKDTETYILDIDCDHIYQFSQPLYKQIECYPADVIPIFDLVVTSVFKELFLYNNNQTESAPAQTSNLNLDDQNSSAVI